MLGPLLGIVAAVLALQWAMRSHRRDRAPWLALLGVRAPDAAAAGGLGALDGVANDGNGAIHPLDAPFSRRKCMAFHIEVVTQEQFGDETTWERVFEDGVGRCLLAGPDGQPRGEVDLQGARMIFPTPLTSYKKLSLTGTRETVFQGTMEQAPPHLAWFVQQLSPEVLQQIWRPSQQLIGGKRVFFNERIVLPGDHVVAAGHCERGPVGVRVRSTDDAPVALGFGTLESERARVGRLPILDEAFGAVLGGGVVCAVVEMVVSMTAGK
ncbi:MAG: hypothetical protein JWM74_4517 [Myxococcaceae bacterium]|nr:hypothetical protein [Myxococcaceae bacterium]